MQKAKKRRFKKWVLYTAYMVALVIFFIIADKIGLIKAYKNTLDITSLVIIIIAWEVLKKSVKACYNREKESE